MLKLLPLLLLVTLSCAQITPIVDRLRPVKESSQWLSPVWIKNLDPDYETGNLPISLSAPLIFEGTLYIGSNQGEMIAYDVDNGRALWRKRDNSTYHSAGIIFKDYLIYGTASGRVIARNAVSGELIYEVDLGASVESSPVLEKDRLFIHLRDHRIVSLDAHTGKILWAYKRSVPQTTTLQRVSRPLILDNSLYVGFADGSLAKIALEDGSLLWEQKISNGFQFVDVDIMPIAVDDQIVVGSQKGSLALVSKKTGEITRRMEIYPSRAPLFYKGKYLIATITGELLIVDKLFAIEKRVKISNALITNVKIWKDRIVLTAADGKVYLLASDSLSILEEKFLGHTFSSVFGDIAIEDKSMALLSSRNRLYVFH